MKAHILIGALTLFSTFASAQEIEAARVCINENLAQFVEIPAKTVGLRNPQQVDGLFGLMHDTILKKRCVAEIATYMAAHDELAFTNLLCEAIDTAMRKYISSENSARLLRQSETCKGENI